MVELVVGHRVQAVARLGPVDGHLEQVAVAPQQDVLVAVAQDEGRGREQLVHPLFAGGDPVACPERPGVYPSANWLLRGEQAKQVLVFSAGDEAPPVGVEPADDDARALPVAGVLDRKGLDGRPPVGVPRLLGGGPAVDLSLELLAVIRGPLGRGRAVDADGVLAHDAAVAPTNPNVPGLLLARCTVSAMACIE